MPNLTTIEINAYFRGWENYINAQAAELLHVDAGEVNCASSASETWLLICDAPDRSAAYIFQIGSDDDYFLFQRIVGAGPNTLRIEFPDPYPNELADFAPEYR